jgi:uncharacterized membrane protein (DUF2068 family)
MPVSSQRPRDRWLFAIGAFKLLKAVLLIALGVGVFRLVHHDIGMTLEHWITRFRADPHDRFFDALIHRATGISHEKLELIGVGTFVYAAIFLTEGIGLLMRKRWAEWMTVVSTSLLLPLEMYELARRATFPRALTLVLNVIVVIYLIVRLRREHRARTAIA